MAVKKLGEFLRPQPRPSQMSSKRPMSRQEAQERRDMMSGMDVEFRADLDPVLKSDPLARLGYGGNIEFIDEPQYSGAWHVPSQYFGPHSGLTAGNQQKWVRPDDIAYTADFGSSPHVISHEMRHRGLDRVKQMYLKDPEAFAKKYGDEAAVYIDIIGQDKDTNEAFTEIGDLPHEDATWLDAEHEGGPRIRKLGETFSTSRRYLEDDAVQKAYSQIQQAAQDALTEAGEPPRTVPKEVEEEAQGWFKSLLGKVGFAEGGLTTNQQRRAQHGGRAIAPEDEQMSLLGLTPKQQEHKDRLLSAGFSIPQSAGPHDKLISPARANEYGYDIYETGSGQQYFVRPPTEEEKPTLITEDIKSGVKTLGEWLGKGAPMPTAKQVAKFGWETGKELIEGAGRVARSEGTLGEALSYAAVPMAPVASAKRASDTLYMFAGKTAKNPPKNKAHWFQGADGEWRFEIDDSKAKVDPTILEKQGAYKLGDLLEHESLYEQYPFLSETLVKVRDIPDGNGASFNEKTGVISISKDLAEEELLPAVLHEVMHSIQRTEGFAGGLSSLHPRYREAMGEVEARAVEARLKLDAEARAKRAPILDERVSRDKQYDSRQEETTIANSSGVKTKENPIFRPRTEPATDLGVGVGTAPYSFYSPVRQTVENMDFGKDGTVAGAAIQSELNRVLNQGGGIRNSELKAVDLPIDPKKRYTKEEAIQMARENTWEITPVYDRAYGTEQRIATTDRVVSKGEDLGYVEITLEASKPTGGTFEPAGKKIGDPGTHYTSNTVAHVRLSQRENPATGDMYLMVEEFQSDLMRAGTKEKVTGIKPITMEEAMPRMSNDLDDLVANMEKPFKNFTPEKKQLILDYVKATHENDWTGQKYKTYVEAEKKVADRLGERGLTLAGQLLEDYQGLLTGVTARKDAPFNKTEDWLRLAVLTTIAEAQKRGVSQIAIPSAEDIAKLRYTQDNMTGALLPLKEEQKAAFYKVYGKTLDKVIRQLETELGTIDKTKKTIKGETLDKFDSQRKIELEADFEELQGLLGDTELTIDDLAAMEFPDLAKFFKQEGGFGTSQAMEVARTFQEDYWRYKSIVDAEADIDATILDISGLANMAESEMRFAQGGLVDYLSPDSFAEYLEERNG